MFHGHCLFQQVPCGRVEGLDQFAGLWQRQILELAATFTLPSAKKDALALLREAIVFRAEQLNIHFVAQHLKPLNKHCQHSPGLKCLYLLNILQNEIVRPVIPKHTQKVEKYIAPLVPQSMPLTNVGEWLAGKSPKA